VGNNLFRSAHNGSVNAAVDTVAIGGTVTWTWTNSGTVPHGVRSLGTTIFRNSVVQTGNGSTHTAVFARAGTYQYDCAVHGAAMTGTIVVQ
jgi:plastocyanin